jgi:hypothetical protein
MCILQKTRLVRTHLFLPSTSPNHVMEFTVEQLDRAVACFTACVHKTLNSHNSMEILAISATMMAYLRAVHDQTNWPGIMYSM